MTSETTHQPIRAAVAREVDKALQFEHVTLKAPRDYEVLVLLDSPEQKLALESP